MISEGIFAKDKKNMYTHSFSAVALTEVGIICLLMLTVTACLLLSSSAQCADLVLLMEKHEINKGDLSAAVCFRC